MRALPERLAGRLVKGNAVVISESSNEARGI